MLLQLVVPAFQVFVGHLAGDVKHHDAGVGAVVVAGVHAVEALLTGCVPNVWGHNNDSGVVVVVEGEEAQGGCEGT
jgi:hypothetical protein